MDQHVKQYVVSVCRGYRNRKYSMGRVSPAVRDEYRRLNKAVEDGVNDIIEEELIRKMMLKCLVSYYGERNQDHYMGLRQFYNLRGRVLVQIAKNLNML